MQTGRGDRRLWGVVLAGGEGRRLAPLTSALYGHDVPKQFAVLDGQRSLLQVTMDRMASLVPPSRTVVIVGEEHERLARRQLAKWTGMDLVLQPQNLDTAPGMLLPLSRIRTRDPDAVVAFFPSDHHLADPGPFRAAVRRAAQATVDHHGLITLLGVVPDHAETEYGWILPGRTLGPGGLRTVRRFEEKPAAIRAGALLRCGGLWNMFVSVGRVSAFLDLAARHLPAHATRFELYARAVGQPREQELLRALYAGMPAANFSRAVLERARQLAVLPVRGCGWSDWGSPARVFQSLAGSAALASLRQRLAAQDATALSA